jgi:hypothetical protein
MNKDQEDDEASSAADDIPTFKEAVQERKKHIAWLRKKGDHERADLIAKCRKDSRCLLGDCPVCDRRREVAFCRYPELAIHDTIEEPLFRFVLHEISVDAIKVVGPRRPINEKKLAALKASITQIGLQTPITKCPVRKSHRAIRTQRRRRQSPHRHSAGRGRKPWNYRAGQGRWREPHSGIRKPHRTVACQRVHRATNGTARRDLDAILGRAPAPERPDPRPLLHGPGLATTHHVQGAS